MFKKILNFFFGKKENTKTQTNSIHEEIAKTLKEREEILNTNKVILSETVSTEKPKKTIIDKFKTRTTDENPCGELK